VGFMHEDPSATAAFLWGTLEPLIRPDAGDALPQSPPVLAAMATHLRALVHSLDVCRRQCAMSEAALETPSGVTDGPHAGATFGAGAGAGAGTGAGAFAAGVADTPGLLLLPEHSIGKWDPSSACIRTLPSHLRCNY
jgi:hypothetical protein